MPFHSFSIDQLTFHHESGWSVPARRRHQGTPFATFRDTARLSFRYAARVGGAAGKAALCGALEFAALCGKPEFAALCGALEFAALCGELEFAALYGALELAGLCGAPELAAPGCEAAG